MPFIDVSLIDQKLDDVLGTKSILHPIVGVVRSRDGE
jgi:hypothetical protein